VTHRSRYLVLFFFAVSCLMTSASAFDWETAAPESQGMASAKLDAIWPDLQKHGTKTFLVIRNDKVVFERYATNYSRTTKHYTASMAKAVVGGVTLSLALDDHRIKPDDFASQYIPQWADVPGKKDIQIRHLATHTSGIEDAEAGGLPHDKLTGWKGEFWKRLKVPRDSFSLSRDAAPLMEPPGTRFRYSNPGMALLSWCVTASLRGGSDTDLRSLLKHRIMDPIGVPESEWACGYTGVTSVDGLPLVANWGGGAYSPNATARVGRLMLRKGNWDGQQLISVATVERVTAHAGLPNNAGLGWWINRELDGGKNWKSVPIDAFYGSGAGNQFLLVIPSLNLIVVRNGDQLDKDVPSHDALEKYIMAPLIQAIAK